jgi:hypothetical protein
LSLLLKPTRAQSKEVPCCAPLLKEYLQHQRAQGGTPMSCCKKFQILKRFKRVILKLYALRELKWEKWSVERSTILAVLYLVTSLKGSRWPVGWLFPAFTSSAKLELHKPIQRVE